MANFERGVYEPGEDVRVFDGSEEEDDVEGSRLPLLIVLALLVLAMFGGVVWMAYSTGVAKGRGETPVLTAANGPEKVAPSQPGGAAVPYQGFKIYEQPAPQDDSSDAAPAAAAPKAAEAPAEKPKPQVAVTPPPAQAAPPPKPAPQPRVAAAEAVTPKAPPPVTKTAPAATKPQTMDSLIRQAENLPAKPVAAAPAGPATAAPRPLGAPAKASGSALLQVGAYKSQADADAAWKTYKARHPSVSGYSEDVAKVDLGEKGTWYRLRIAGFADRNAASAACDKLKADGAACMPAK